MAAATASHNARRYSMPLKAIQKRSAEYTRSDATTEAGVAHTRNTHAQEKPEGVPKQPDLVEIRVAVEGKKDEEGGKDIRLPEVCKSDDATASHDDASTSESDMSGGRVATASGSSATRRSHQPQGKQDPVYDLAAASI